MPSHVRAWATILFALFIYSFYFCWMTEKKRKGARRIADIPADILRQINCGEIETASLVECLAIDFPVLLSSALPNLPKSAISQISEAASLGWKDKTMLASQLIYNHFGVDTLPSLLAHKSDIVRGWAAGVIACIPDISIAHRLELVKPLADDSNSGTREVAWMLLRPSIAIDVATSVSALESWVKHESPNIRRFAVEITRPRGVWCSHIAELKTNPQIALPLLDPLKSDTSRYVQNSVANWLNDAGKTRGAWAQDLTTNWLETSPSKETAYICKRARRNL